MVILAAILWAAPAADVNPPRVGHEPPKAADSQGNWRLWFEVRDESEIFGAALYFATDQGAWQTIEPEQVAPGWLEAVVPATAGLRYFFEVFDEHGNGPTRVGSSEVPFVLQSPAGELSAVRPWDAPKVIVAEPVFRPWWLKRPPAKLIYAALGTVALSGVIYGSYTLLRDRPVSKVTLIPVGKDSQP